MLALNHATLATATAFGLSLYFKEPFFLPLIIFVVFAGVFPDIDHPNSELGRYFKPVAKVLPHRGITHSILGVGIFWGIIYFFLNNQNQIFTYVLILAAFFGVNLLEKILEKNITKIDDITLNFVSEKQAYFLLRFATTIINFFLFSLLFLVWNNRMREDIFLLLVIGYIAHIIGDFITKEGVPLFYPFKKKFGLKLFRTGGPIEGFLGFILVVINIYLIYQFCLINQVLTFDYWQLNLR
jgi:inner membrane protein